MQEFEKEDIEQSTHPMVTVTPHLRNAIGVLVVSEDVKKGLFSALVEKETAVPCRRTGVFAVPKEGGDVLVKICEGIRDIKVTKKEKPKNYGMPASDDSDLDSDDDEEEDEEMREKVWKVGSVLGEAAIKGVKKGGKVEVMIKVEADLGVQIEVREAGVKVGVRGNVGKAKAVENGSA